MGQDKSVWVIVADIDGARLLQGTRTEYEHMHLDEEATLATGFVAREHHRPTRLGSPGRSSPLGHEDDVKTTKFAAELAPWIEKELRERGIAQCTLFAPSHLLGALRKSLGGSVAAKVTEQAGEFAQMATGELAKHPRIAALLQG